MTTQENHEQELRIQRKLLPILIVGFVTMTAGLILVAVATVFIQSGETSFAGIIFIGPFPIIFGAGPGAQWLILVLMTLAVLMLIMLIILRRKPPEG